MPLTGVNNKCCRCINDCKQYRQVIVVKCPKFKFSGKSKIPAVVKAEETLQAVLPARTTRHSAWIRQGVA